MSVFDGAGGIKKEPAVREGIGGDVDDAHHQGAVAGDHVFLAYYNAVPETTRTRGRTREVAVPVPDTINAKPRRGRVAPGRFVRGARSGSGPGGVHLPALRR